QGHVTINPNLDEEISQLCSFTQKLPKLLWMFETSKTGLRQRVDVYDLAAASLGEHQGSQHAGMIGAGVLADHKNRIGQIEILEGHGAFAKPERLFHAGATGFVTHVRTIGQIVGAELPHKELIEK